jgi:hypothetical protein
VQNVHRAGHFTNNLTYEIRHPEMVSLTRSVLHLAKLEAHGTVLEYVMGLALLHIIQYEFLPQGS